MATTRLTAGQALIRFLIAQRVEHDGTEHPFFPGIWGIFGHGNIGGLAQAIQQYEAELPYYLARNEQAMVHAAVAYAKMSNRRQAFACLSSIGPGAANMVTGAATATVNRLPALHHRRRHLRRAGAGAGAPAGRERALARGHDQRRVPPGGPLLGPHQPSRAADHLAARGHAHPHLTGRHRRGVPRRSRRTSAPSPTTTPRSCSPPAPGTSPATAPTPGRRRARRRGDPGARGGPSSSPVAAPATARPRRPSRRSPRRPASPSRRPTPARGRCTATTR